MIDPSELVAVRVQVSCIWDSLTCFCFKDPKTLADGSCSYGGADANIRAGHRNDDMRGLQGYLI